jgi:hypothetical protein
LKDNDISLTHSNSNSIDEKPNSEIPHIDSGVFSSSECSSETSYSSSDSESSSSEDGNDS